MKYQTARPQAAHNVGRLCSGWKIAFRLPVTEAQIKAQAHCSYCDWALFVRLELQPMLAHS